MNVNVNMYVYMNVCPCWYECSTYGYTVPQHTPHIDTHNEICSVLHMWVHIWMYTIDISYIHCMQYECVCVHVYVWVYNVALCYVVCACIIYFVHNPYTQHNTTLHKHTYTHTTYIDTLTCNTYRYEYCMQTYIYS